MKIAAIQINAPEDKAANVAKAFSFMERAMQEGRPDLIVLPENFTCHVTDAALMARNAEAMPGGPTYDALSRFARDNNVNIHAGSMSEAGPTKPFNTTVVFDRQGREIARYRKIHRFDITAPDGTRYFESDVVGGGQDIVTYKIDNVTFGCAICFDLRFGELFRALVDRGAEVIVIPSAFTYTTGEAHWQTLIRARAIECQTYIIAPNQTGRFDAGTKAHWGHSLMVDPWGVILAEAGMEETVIHAEIDPAMVATVRQRIPIADLRVLDR